MTEGLRQAGFDCLFANDMSHEAIQTFRINHPTAYAVHAPIEGVDALEVRNTLGLQQGELDCLVGGPPCQGFSINAPGRFLDDPRNGLFRHYLRFVDEFLPKTVFFENVPGMLSFANGLIVSTLLDELIKRQYDVSQKILFAAHYGVPQERWRLIILASRVGPAPDHPLPTHVAHGRANFRGGRTLTYRAAEYFGPHAKGQVTVAEALDDLPVLSSGQGSEEMPYDRPPQSVYAEDIRHGSEQVLNHFAPRLAPINLARLKHIPPGGSWRDIPRKLLPAGMKLARKSDHTRRYGRLSAGGLSGTV
ncbi:MAG: DNA cytosine methyltransferase, partial [Dehalococcoidia bacterium]